MIAIKRDIYNISPQVYTYVGLPRSRIKSPETYLTCKKLNVLKTEKKKNQGARNSPANFTTTVSTVVFSNADDLDKGR